MAVDAVLDLIRVAGETEGQTISHSLLRMLQKLARHAGSGVGDRETMAEESVRDRVGTLLRGWSLEDPNPDAYGKALEDLSKSDPVEASAEATLTAAPHRHDGAGAERYRRAARARCGRAGSQRPAPLDGPRH